MASLALYGGHTDTNLQHFELNYVFRVARFKNWNKISFERTCHVTLDSTGSKFSRKGSRARVTPVARKASLARTDFLCKKDGSAFWKIQRFEKFLTNSTQNDIDSATGSSFRSRGKKYNNLCLVTRITSLNTEGPGGISLPHDDSS